MKNKELIGRKFRGFKFEDTYTNKFNFYHQKKVGEILTIHEVTDRPYIVTTGGDRYPIEEVKKHLIPENEVIKVLNEEPEIKWVWVRNEEGKSWMKRIFLADLGEQFTYRYQCVVGGSTEEYLEGKSDVSYGAFSKISYTDPNEQIKKEIKELEEKINVLKSKLCK